jgi:hypothetical protein
VVFSKLLISRFLRSKQRVKRADGRSVAERQIRRANETTFRDSVDPALGWPRDTVRQRVALLAQGNQICFGIFA